MCVSRVDLVNDIPPKAPNSPDGQFLFRLRRSRSSSRDGLSCIPNFPVGVGVVEVAAVDVVNTVVFVGRPMAKNENPNELSSSSGRWALPTWAKLA